MSSTRRRAHRRKVSRGRTYRRRMRGGKVDFLLEKMRTLFPEFDASRFTIHPSYGVYQLQITQCKEQAKHPYQYLPRFSITYDSEKDESESAENFFQGEKMYIGRLTSCDGVSGPEIIRRLAQLARQLGLVSIHLDDASKIYFPKERYGDDHCEVDLPILRILLKGQSWYESLGFVSATSEEDRANNERVRQMPFGRFLALLMEKERQVEKERIQRRYAINRNQAQRNRSLATLKEKRSVLEGVREAFPEMGEDVPVAAAIQKMVEQVNATENACESEPFRLFKQVIHLCSASEEPIIRYTMDNLTMTL